MGKGISSTGEKLPKRCLFQFILFLLLFGLLFYLCETRFSLVSAEIAPDKRNFYQPIIKSFIRLRFISPNNEVE